LVCSARFHTYHRLITYALAFDDQTSTFIIPSGAGFEVIFCPGARSTNILDTSMEQMLQLAQHGQVDKKQAMMLKRSRQEMFKSASRTTRPSAVLLVAILVSVLCIMSIFE
jgi:hypothetical protein